MGNHSWLAILINWIILGKCIPSRQEVTQYSDLDNRSRSPSRDQAWNARSES